MNYWISGTDEIVLTQNRSTLEKYLSVSLPTVRSSWTLVWDWSRPSHCRGRQL